MRPQEQKDELTFPSEVSAVDLVEELHPDKGIEDDSVMNRGTINVVTCLYIQQAGAQEEQNHSYNDLV